MAESAGLGHRGTYPCTDVFFDSAARRFGKVPPDDPVVGVHLVGHSGILVPRIIWWPPVFAVWAPRFAGKVAAS